MAASKHQLPASAYHLKPADVRKLRLSANNFRDRCLIKTPGGSGFAAANSSISMFGISIQNANG